MCTASWWFSRDGSYELFFNRDEQKTRLPAEHPRIFSSETISYLAPIDADRGGTWLAVNEFGVTVCLLNFYQANGTVPSTISRRSTSRGQLVLDCATAGDIAKVRELAEAKSFTSYAPFHLLAFSLGGDRLSLSWDGSSLVERSGRVEAPFTTSSFETEAVVAERHRRYRALADGLAPEQRPPLEDFQNQHDMARAPYSVLMHRTDACTVSQTVVRVSRSHVTMTYRPISWAVDGRRDSVSTFQLPIRVSSPFLS